MNGALRSLHNAINFHVRHNAIDLRTRTAERHCCKKGDDVIVTARAGA
jgi:hypothetical protein